jgi:methionyl-tRNA synthetase
LSKGGCWDTIHEMNKKKILIAVAWPYVNGNLHIGHVAGNLLPADITARFYRLIGNEVLMVSGSDCFGTPITVEADKRGVKPEEIVEEYHARNIALFEKLGMSYDLYTTTTTENIKE